MKPSLHLGVYQLTLLSLTLLYPIPWSVAPCPLPPTTPNPTVDRPELESALLHLQAALRDPAPQVSAQWPHGLQRGTRQHAEKVKSWGEEALLRDQRGDLIALPLSPFPGGHSLESIYYQDGGDGEDGGKRNEALTSIAGGLQAVSREKGGFGFRFGRKRWTDQGWRDEGRGGQMELMGESF